MDQLIIEWPASCLPSEAINMYINVTLVYCSLKPKEFKKEEVLNSAVCFSNAHYAVRCAFFCDNLKAANK